MQTYEYMGVLIVHEEDTRGTADHTFRIETVYDYIGWKREKNWNDYPLSPTIDFVVGLYLRRDPRVVEITDGKFPRRLFDHGFWESRITCPHDRIGLSISGLAVDAADVRDDYLNGNCDVHVKLAIKALRGGWTVTNAEWMRAQRDPMYAQYRLSGETPFLGDETLAIMDNVGMTKKEGIRLFLESYGYYEFCRDLNSELWTRWTKKYEKEYNRVRVVYVAGERRQFRLREEFPDHRMLEDDELSMILSGGPEAMISLIAQRIKRDSIGIKPLVEGGHSSYQTTVGDDVEACIYLDELTRNGQFEEEGEDMDHCVGNGEYFRACSSGRLRVFSGELDIDSGSETYRVTIAVTPARAPFHSNGAWRIASIYGPGDSSVDDYVADLFRAAIYDIMPEWVSGEQDESELRFE